MSSNCCQKHTPGNCKQTHIHSTSHLNFVFALYLVKTSSDFCGIQYIKYTQHCTSLHQELWPQNSPELIPVDYKVWSFMQERVYHRPILDVADLERHLTVAWSDCSSTSSTRQLTSSVVHLCEN